MPIRPALRPLYPPHWRELSRRVRFERAGGICQGCGRPHLARLNCLPDGRWFDPATATWRDHRGRPARWPDLLETTRQRTTRVVLAAAHLDHNPRHNRQRNLRALCQRCHLLHDRQHHLTQRWLTYRQRWALGDFFLGAYGSIADHTCLGFPRQAGAQSGIRVAALSWGNQRALSRNGTAASGAIGVQGLTDLESDPSAAADAAALGSCIHSA